MYLIRLPTSVNFRPFVDNISFVHISKIIGSMYSAYISENWFQNFSVVFSGLSNKQNNLLAVMNLACIFVHFTIYEFWMHIFYVIHFFAKRTYLSPYYYLKFVGIANRDWFAKFNYYIKKGERTVMLILHDASNHNIITLFVVGIQEKGKDQHWNKIR